MSRNSPKHLNVRERNVHVRIDVQCDASRESPRICSISTRTQKPVPQQRSIEHALSPPPLLNS